MAAGARLRYSFREFGYAGTLPCTVTAFIPGQRIAIGFSDARFEASFDFLLDHRDGVTTITHHVELLPKSLAVRLVGGMLRRALRGAWRLPCMGSTRPLAGRSRRMRNEPDISFAGSAPAAA